MHKGEGRGKTEGESARHSRKLGTARGHQKLAGARREPSLEPSEDARPRRHLEPTLPDSRVVRGYFPLTLICRGKAWKWAQGAWRQRQSAVAPGGSDLLWGPGFRSLKSPPLRGQKAQFASRDYPVFTLFYSLVPDACFLLPRDAAVCKSLWLESRPCPGRLAPVLGTYHPGAGTPSARPSRPLWGEECHKPGQYHENDPLASPPLLQSGSRLLRGISGGDRARLPEAPWGCPPPHQIEEMSHIY